MLITLPSGEVVITSDFDSDIRWFESSLGSEIHLYKLICTKRWESGATSSEPTINVDELGL